MTARLRLNEKKGLAIIILFIVLSIYDMFTEGYRLSVNLSGDFNSAFVHYNGTVSGSKNNLIAHIPAYLNLPGCR
jgi:hypothetical protein